MNSLDKQAVLPLHMHIRVEYMPHMHAPHRATAQVHDHFALKLIVGIIHLQGC